MKKVILSLLVLAAMLSVLDAAPFQTMGMLRTPDAYILPNKAAEIQFVNYLRKTRDIDLHYVPYGMLSVGILDQIELGLYGGDDVFFANLKIKLLQETLKYPQVSVGLENIFSPVPTDFKDMPATDYFNSNFDGDAHPDAADYEAYSPYVVVSKQAVIGGVHSMFNLGVGMHRFVGQVSRSRIFSGSFASIEVSPFNNFSMLGEYDGRDFNGGMKYTWDNFSFKLGYQAIENLFKKSEGNGYEKDIRAAFSVSYLFDQFASTKRRRPDLIELASANDLTPYDDGQYVVDYPMDDGIQTGDTGTEPGDTGTVVTGDTGTQTRDDGTVVTGDTGTEPGDTGTVVTGDTGTQTGTEVAITNPPVTPPVVRTPTPEMQELVTELQRLQQERARAENSLQELRNWINSLRTPNP